MQKIRDRDAAQEIVQDVFLSLFNTSASLNKVSSLMAYLYVVLKNRILDQYRHELVHKKYEGYVANTFTELDHSTQEWIETRELENRLKAEIEKLPPQCRNVFKLSREEFKSNREIAATLEISENTVEQHMRKALRILRAAFYPPEKILSITLLSAAALSVFKRLLG